MKYFFRDIKYQRTICRPVIINGLGIHSRTKSKIRMYPASYDNGIIFYFLNNKIVLNIEVLFNNFINCSFSSNLFYNNIILYTFEHLLATLHILLIDNINIFLDGNEIPIMDGSSWIFICLFSSVGIKKLKKKRKIIIIKKYIKIIEKKSICIAKACNNFKIFNIFNYYLFYNNKFCYFNLYKISFIRLISKSRTFGLLLDYLNFLKKNLSLGSEFSNVIVLNYNDIINKFGLRYNNELVFHKIIDIIGDFLLLGYNIFGEFYFFNSNHKTNRLFLKKIFENSSNWDIITL